MRSDELASAPTSGVLSATQTVLYAGHAETGIRCKSMVQSKLGTVALHSTVRVGHSQWRALDSLRSELELEIARPLNDASVEL